MPIINQALFDKIPEYLKDIAVHYPDIILFQHDAALYRAHWQRLARNKYLYTDGCEIRGTNWLHFAFESIKGWLGSSNGCSQSKVQMSLRKLAYYGYLNGYSQDPLKTMNFYPLEPDFIRLVSQKRNNTASASLQQQLVHYFATHVRDFNFNSVFFNLSTSYIFGSSWLNIGEYAEIPRLDPQNDWLIEKTVEQLSLEYDHKIAYSFISSSIFALKASEDYIKKAQQGKESRFYGWPINNIRRNTQFYLKTALVLDPNCYKEHLTLYIELYIELADYQKAYECIAQLTDTNLAMEYLIKHFKRELLIQLVPKDSTLAIELTKYYLSQNNRETTLRTASQLVSQLGQHDPQSGFILLVKDQEFDKAYELFEMHRESVTFDSNALSQLSEHFVISSKNLYKQGSAHREKKEWGKAKDFYKKSMEAAQKAMVLQSNFDTKELVYMRKRLYAQVLINSDKDLHEPLKCETTVIEEAIQLLDECHSKKDDEMELHILALVNGLMRRADYETHVIAVPLIYSHDVDTRKSHGIKHKTNFEMAAHCLRRVIELLEGTKDSKLKKILGKAHFILGDMILFFGLQQDYKSHFKRAFEVVPDNPYYLLRGSEHFELRKDELRNRGVPLLKALGHDIFAYMHWDEQRWEQGGPVYGSIHDIHGDSIQGSKQPSKTFR